MSKRLIEFPREYEWVVAIREISPMAKLILIHLLYSVTEVVSEGILMCRQSVNDLVRSLTVNIQPYQYVRELMDLGLITSVGKTTTVNVGKLQSLYELYVNNVSSTDVEDNIEKKEENVQEEVEVQKEEEKNVYQEKVKEILRNKKLLSVKRKKDPVVEKLVVVLHDRKSANFYAKVVEYVSSSTIDEALQVVIDRMREGQLRNAGAYFVGVLRNMIGGTFPWEETEVQHAI